MWEWGGFNPSLFADKTLTQNVTQNKNINVAELEKQIEGNEVNEVNDVNETNDTNEG